jgi:hypothetical protein
MGMCQAYIPRRTVCHNTDLLICCWPKRAGNPMRLGEAQSYAERTLEIMAKLDTSAQPWVDLQTLAGIAALEGRVGAAQYRDRRKYPFYPLDKQPKPAIILCW